MNNLIQLTDKQKTNIFESIKKYIENIDNPDVKFKTKQKIQDNNFKKFNIKKANFHLENWLIYIF